MIIYLVICKINSKTKIIYFHKIIQILIFSKIIQMLFNSNKIIIK